MTCSFQRIWLTDPAYAGWLQAVNGDKRAAFCLACKKNIHLSNMGERALKSHAGGKKHGRNITGKPSSVSSFFKAEKPASDVKSSTSTENPTSEGTFSLQFQEDASEHTLCAGNEEGFEGLNIPQPPPVPEPEQGARAAPKINRYLEMKESRKAEILWALKCVVDHFSFTSNEDISLLFKAMFWDSNIAKNYNSGRTKVAYLITYGIAPSFRESLLDAIQEKPAFTIVFDEAFNKVLQEDQMDVLVRYWQADKVVTRYLSSQFLSQTKAEDLLASLKQSLDKLRLQCVLQVSMDGPKVNLKLYKLLVEDRKGIAPDVPDMFDIGICSLHVVHGALRTGVTKTGWELAKFVKSLWWLFRDTYGRRSDYTEITGSSVFPMKFCETRWVEDKNVAQRAIEVLPNIKKYVTETLKKKKSDIPTCASFATVKEAVLTDPLLLAKLEFFAFVSGTLQPFLMKYQTEQPMIAFLATDLAIILHDLAELFIKPDVLTANSSQYKLSVLEVDDKDNQLPAKKITIGNGTKQAITASKATDLQKLAFYSECVALLSALVLKIQERCPLKYSFVRALVALNPQMMAEKQDTAKKAFSTVVQKFTAARQMTSEQSDSAERQFKRLLREKTSALQRFDPKDHRLDEFFFSLLSGEDSYNQLWFLIQRVLLLSHGQASVERGFSVNEDLLPNLKKETLMGLRCVYDTMRHLNVKVHEFNVSDRMLQHCSQARTRYSLYLTEQASIKKTKAFKRKASEAEEQYSTEKKKLKALEEEAQSCRKEAEKKSAKALQSHDFNILAQSVALRKKADKMQMNEIATQKKLVEELEQKMTQK